MTADLLARTDLFVYSTTHATNAILERTTARTAFLVTEGFPDVLVRREGGKTNPFDFGEPYPDPYVPRRLTFEVRERIGAQGEIVEPLDEARTRELVRSLSARSVEAVGVCLLWSIANPVHEEAVGRILDEELPGVPYTLSHRLNPTMREYRRASSTVIDASLKPLLQGHLLDMERDLRGAGFGGELVMAISVGGVMHVRELVDRPIYAVKSGPSLAPIAGRTYAEAELGGADVIVCDTGGTSFDVSLVRGGRIVSTRETWLGPRYTGHLTGLSSVDVRSIGAGGGSIAWLDPGGLLRVGPRSAGAAPGPACYGRGGAEPTVTDAAVVLGYLDPAFFLGGRMSLDVDAARSGVGGLAGALGESIERTAHGILAVANEHMVEAIKEITINEGVDPRESLVVAGGGAAGINIVPIARELGCRRVLVPATAGALSACGGAVLGHRRRAGGQPADRDPRLRVRRGQRGPCGPRRLDRRVRRRPARTGLRAVRDRLLGRGALPLPGVGRRGAARGWALRRPRGRRGARGGVPSDPRAGLRRSGARPAGRVRELEGAPDRAARAPAARAGRHPQARTRAAHPAARRSSTAPARRRCRSISVPPWPPVRSSPARP